MATAMEVSQSNISSRSNMSTPTGQKVSANLRAQAGFCCPGQLCVLILLRRQGGSWGEAIQARKSFQ
jgi:hypothetical protein